MAWTMSDNCQTNYPQKSVGLWYCDNQLFVVDHRSVHYEYQQSNCIIITSVTLLRSQKQRLHSGGACIFYLSRRDNEFPSKYYIDQAHLKVWLWQMLDLEDGGLTLPTVPSVQMIQVGGQSQS